MCIVLFLFIDLCIVRGEVANNAIVARVSLQVLQQLAPWATAADAAAAQLFLMDDHALGPEKLPVSATFRLADELEDRSTLQLRLPVLLLPPAQRVSATAPSPPPPLPVLLPQVRYRCNLCDVRRICHGLCLLAALPQIPAMFTDIPHSLCVQGFPEICESRAQAAYVEADRRGLAAAVQGVAALLRAAPFGEPIAALLEAVTGLATGAVTNTDNCKKLLRVAVCCCTILAGSPAEVLARNAAAATELAEVLRNARELFAQFGAKSFIRRLLSSGSDKQAFEELSGRLATWMQARRRRWYFFCVCKRHRQANV